MAKGIVKVNHAFRLKPTEMKVADGETSMLKLTPRRRKHAERIAGALKRGEKATAKLQVKLTDLAGNKEVERLNVKLKR